MARTFFEFFAGGGMARLGLGPNWRCLFANDFDPEKAESYRLNWGGAEFFCGDLAGVTVGQLPGAADLAWASFPCQDLSLAGNGKGMGAAQDQVKTRSGAFWLFHDKMRALRQHGRAPKLVVLENVPGVLTSHGGRDFCAIVAALGDLGYLTGAFVLDARFFTPQSRPRVFFVAAREKDFARGIAGAAPTNVWTPPALLAAQAKLSPELSAHWVWWRLPEPAPRHVALIDLLEDDPAQAPWRSAAATQNLLDLMAPAHLERIREVQASGARAVGAVYRRTRLDADGRKVQRAEIRFDGMAGCLRTPGGGSSRQTLLEVHGDRLRSRLLSPREAARLMGLPDSYMLPRNATLAYKLCGDGLCVPVIRHLADHLLEPLLNSTTQVAAAE
jgi:DNA (cytosine-5)-methyltransferase 1